MDDLAQVAGDVDVLYQTRIQKERFQAGPTPMSALDSCPAHVGRAHYPLERSDKSFAILTRQRSRDLKGLEGKEWSVAVETNHG